VGADINELIGKLESEKIISTEEKELWEDTFGFNLFIGDDKTAQDNRMNMVFGKDIVTDIQKFIDEIVEVIDDNDAKQSWKNFIGINLGYTTIGGTSSEVIGGILNQYKKQKEIVKNRFDKFFNDYFNKKFTLYKPYNESKKRILDFSTQQPVNPTDADNLQNLNGKNSTGDKYNLKTSFN
jgi:hypothetical protein